jgi:hypothetical protein
LTPEEYRELRRRRAEGNPPLAVRRCAGCGVGASLTGSPYCGPCALIITILAKPGATLPD